MTFGESGSTQIPLGKQFVCPLFFFVYFPYNLISIWGAAVHGHPEQQRQLQLQSSYNNKVSNVVTVLTKKNISPDILALDNKKTKNNDYMLYSSLWQRAVTVAVTFNEMRKQFQSYASGFSCQKNKKHKETAGYLGRRWVQVIQVCATAATMKSNHGCLESVVLYLRVSVIEHLFIRQVCFAGVNLWQWMEAVWPTGTQTWPLLLSNLVSTIQSQIAEMTMQFYVSNSKILLIQHKCIP